MGMVYNMKGSRLREFPRLVKYACWPKMQVRYIGTLLDVIVSKHSHGQENASLVESLASKKDCHYWNLAGSLRNIVQREWYGLLQ